MNSLQDPQQHDDLLNYRLKSLVSLGGAPAIRLCEGRFGVSRLEWRLVAALVESGPQAPTALACRARVDPARNSRALQRLAAKGLVERGEVPGNRGRAVVSVTAAGRSLYDALWPQLAAINRRLMGALDDEEAAVLDRCLCKLMANAERIQDEGGGVDVRTDRRLGGSRRFWSPAIE
jgi:DNA-binding MarR family transcriptional regulator